MACKNGRLACFADDQMYNLISLKKESITPLFPYDQEVLRPIVHSISRNEWVLVTGSPQGFGIGIFVSGSGEPIRGTLQWPSIPISITYEEPYLVTLLQNSMIQIHNLDTQDLIQTIQIPSTAPPKFMKSMKNSKADDNVDKHGMMRILLGTSQEIFCLQMLSWTRQIEDLFDFGRVEDAIRILKKLEMSGNMIFSVSRIHLKIGISKFVFFCRVEFAC